MIAVGRMAPIVHNHDGSGGADSTACGRLQQSAVSFGCQLILSNFCSVLYILHPVAPSKGIR
jgi:hypothetical protein